MSPRWLLPRVLHPSLSPSFPCSSLSLNYSPPAGPRVSRCPRGVLAPGHRESSAAAAALLLVDLEVRPYQLEVNLEVSKVPIPRPHLATLFSVAPPRHLSPALFYCRPATRPTAPRTSLYTGYWSRSTADEKKMQGQRTREHTQTQREDKVAEGKQTRRERGRVRVAEVLSVYVCVCNLAICFRFRGP